MTVVNESPADDPKVWPGRQNPMYQHYSLELDATNAAVWDAAKLAPWVEIKDLAKLAEHRKRLLIRWARANRRRAIRGLPPRRR